MFFYFVVKNDPLDDSLTRRTFKKCWSGVHEDTRTNCVAVCKDTKGTEFLTQTQIPISLQPGGVNLLLFKLRLFDLTKFIV